MSQRLEVIDPAVAPPVWAALRNEAMAAARDESALASLLATVILNHKSLADSLSYQLARKLGDQELRGMTLREVAQEAYASDPALVEIAEADLRAVFERDPACKGYLQPFLFFKGYLALQIQRVAHWLWNQGRETLAFYLQSRMSELFQVDIHPATRIGRGVFVDHGTGIVIGETAVIGDDVSMLQGVTLGGTGAERDMQAVLDRDPATRSTLQPFLFFKGFLALQTHRVGHWLWGQGRETLALFLQSRMSELYAVDIHPAAPIGSGVFIDHATGVVIGETARVGDDVSMLHGVTLGGTGKVFTDRHPKIGNGVLLGAGSKVLGNITVGDEARVGSGSVVLSDVPPRCSVAGVPAKPVGGACMQPAKTMDQRFDVGL